LSVSDQANKEREMDTTMEMPRMVEPAMLSPEELATYLGCGRTYAYKLLADGAVPSLKLGRLRRVRRVDADAFIERLAEQSDRGEEARA
jgi:excisionase family DNA binding protein